MCSAQKSASLFTLKCLKTITQGHLNNMEITAENSFKSNQHLCAYERDDSLIQFLEVNLPRDDFLFKNSIKRDFLWGAAWRTQCTASSQSQELWDQLRRTSCPLRLPLHTAPNTSTLRSAFCITNPWFTVNQIDNLPNDYSRHTSLPCGAIGAEFKAKYLGSLGKHAV